MSCSEAGRLAPREGRSKLLAMLGTVALHVSVAWWLVESPEAQSAPGTALEMEVVDRALEPEPPAPPEPPPPEPPPPEPPPPQRRARPRPPEPPPQPAPEPPPVEPLLDRPDEGGEPEGGFALDESAFASPATPTGWSLPAPSPVSSAKVAGPGGPGKAGSGAGSGEGPGFGEPVMEAAEVDKLPRPLYRAAPSYPRALRDEGVTGWVEVKMLVGSTGRVEEALVLRSSPPGLFDQAALGSVLQWRFSPALYRGRPVRMWARQRIRFELE